MSSVLTTDAEHSKKNRKGNCSLHPVPANRRGRQFSLLGVLLLALLCAAYFGDHINIPRVHSAATNIAPESQQLTSEGQAQLRAILKAASLPELRRPQFRNLQREVTQLYESLPGALPWVRNSRLTPHARAMVELLKTADAEGLNPEDYDGPRWDERIARTEISTPVPESTLVQFDVALTVSSMRYVSDLRLGRVNPAQFHFELEVGDRAFDLSEFIHTELIHSTDTRYAVKAMEPPLPTYHRTLVALETYRRLASQDDGERLPIPQTPVKPGDSYVGVARLTKLLTLVGDLPEEERGLASLAIYDGVLADAVKHFQQRHGLEPNGLLDAGTLRELNTPLARRVTQLQLTLERLRWLPHRFEPPFIVVNIPEFRLRAVGEQYHWVLFTKVVVGKAYQRQTPVFAAEVKSLIFRPYWNVPLSITQGEMLPHLERDPEYLTKYSYQIINSAGSVVSGDLVTDGIKRMLYSGELRVRQTPGPQNALGLIKFDLPNAYGVYMHGTPATELFARSRRDFSHGCIRVEDPVALATWLLRDKPEWNADRILASMLGERTFRVDLDKPVPVLIVYGTAVVMENGEVRFFRDIYRQDTALEKALMSRRSF